MNTHRRTQTERNTSQSLSSTLSPSHLLFERWRPAGAPLLGSSSVSAPPSCYMINLSAHPHPRPLHLEPVCASLGRPCTAQTKPSSSEGGDVARVERGRGCGKKEERVRGSQQWAGLFCIINADAEQDAQYPVEELQQAALVTAAEPSVAALQLLHKYLTSAATEKKTRTNYRKILTVHTVFQRRPSSIQVLLKVNHPGQHVRYRNINFSTKCHRSL